LTDRTIDRTQFKEFLARLEGEERTVIPEVIIFSLIGICNRLKINPVTNASKITLTWTRSWLHDIGYSHYFENGVKIMTLLTHQRAIPLEEEQRTQLINHFQMVQESYDRFKKGRSNFLSYAYVTYKLCEILGYTQFMPLLIFYKNHENLFQAENVWKSMCAHVGLPFHPTCPSKLRSYRSRSIFVDPKFEEEGGGREGG
jgi:hypothetical protein